jgi:hypothetical protein
VFAAFSQLPEPLFWRAERFEGFPLDFRIGRMLAFLKSIVLILRQVFALSP